MEQCHLGATESKDTEKTALIGPFGSNSYLPGVVALKDLGNTRKSCLHCASVFLCMVNSFLIFSSAPNSKDQTKWRNPWAKQKAASEVGPGQPVHETS